MIYLYSGSGASGFDLKEERMSADEWTALRNNACKLLSAKHGKKASRMLEKFPFELYSGTNFFNDDFFVLYAKIPIDEYVKLQKNNFQNKYKLAFADIAHTLSDFGPYVRHIAIDYLIETGVSLVKTPSLETTSFIVEHALRDAESLVCTSGAPNAIDRVHTAFHGYLKNVCEKAKISYERDTNITAFFKLIRENHPQFEQIRTDANIKRVVFSMSAIVDALNHLRNHASIVHPTEKLLPKSEAMLIINTTRTLLHYLDQKLKIK
ncbi:MAG: abortive infection family protein [Candidatus Omnitrophica bacterium]|nr:abortive infection family protein [Candidatus Omnitrophota bacterium]MDD5488513.1 abortive infection family protein [Candidatus Omnitrophota bacterium]